jgi:hypothetical protein
MKKPRKDKNGWYKFSSGIVSDTFINDSIPNIICKRIKIVALYPHIVQSGKLIDNGNTFEPDGKINLQGFKAKSIYKNNTEIQKLLKERANV